jgi:hypothetical protein
LKWKDITFQNQTINKEEIDFVKINVRKETSKVRKSRVVKIRDDLAPEKRTS